MRDESRPACVSSFFYFFLFPVEPSTVLFTIWEITYIYLWLRPPRRQVSLSWLIYDLDFHTTSEACFCFFFFFFFFSSHQLLYLLFLISSTKKSVTFYPTRILSVTKCPPGCSERTYRPSVLLSLLLQRPACEVAPCCRAGLPPTLPCTCLLCYISTSTMKHSRRFRKEV